MREDVDRARLTHFLEELGTQFRGRARLYLTGGESMVWRGLRGMTRDIDIAYEVAQAERKAFIRTLRALKDSLRVNVEEADPSQFVPLPEGASGRAEFVQRFGGVDVYLFDPYSIALSKLSRGHARDLADVRALLDAHVLRRERLVTLCEATLEASEGFSLRFDPSRVRRHLERVLAERPE